MSHPVTCPFCGSHDTEPMSLFGKQLLTVQYYCAGCRTPFEKVKDEASFADFDGDRPVRAPEDPASGRASGRLRS